MRFHRTKLLSLFDENVGRGGHVSAITGLLGEDLLLALLFAYWEQQGYGAKVVSEKCKGKTNRGARLDAWILRERGRDQTLFQCEIKNWSSYSFREESIPVNCGYPVLQKYMQRQWDHYFKPNVRMPYRSVEKVLDRMEPPKGFDGIIVRPLLCFWFPITDANGECFSTARNVPGPKDAYRELDVFSGSLFLRKMEDRDVIEIPTDGMKRFRDRLELLEDIMPDRS